MRDRKQQRAYTQDQQIIAILLEQKNTKESENVNGFRNL